LTLALSKINIDAVKKESKKVQSLEAVKKELENQ
jgi:hypothetical protein